MSIITLTLIFQVILKILYYRILPKLYQRLKDCRLFVHGPEQ